MNGMMFGTEGPLMQGTWYNPKNGDAFTVRDSFFEDNQYVVTTTDGRYIKYDQLQNYLQTDMKLEDLKKMKTEKQQKIEEPIPAEVASILENIDPNDSYLGMLSPDDLMIGRNTPTLGNLNDENRARHIAPASEHQVKQSVVITDMNYTCIEKALKNTPMPKFNIELNWSDYPTKNIEMLKDIMDIPMEEILDWYLEKIDMLEIAENIKEIMKKHILGDIKEEIVPVSPALTMEDLNNLHTSVKPKKTKKTQTKS